MEDRMHLAWVSVYSWNIFRLFYYQHLQSSAGEENRHGDCTLEMISRSTILHRTHFPKQIRPLRKRPFSYKTPTSCLPHVRPQVCTGVSRSKPVCLLRTAHVSVVFVWSEEAVRNVVFKAFREIIRARTQTRPCAQSCRIRRLVCSVVLQIWPPSSCRAKHVLKKDWHVH